MESIQVDCRDINEKGKECMPPLQVVGAVAGCVEQQ
jgi:hypothetical protein